MRGTVVINVGRHKPIAGRLELQGRPIGLPDFVIVRAASAACVRAARYNVDLDATVLLLEAGPSDTYLSKRFETYASRRLS